MNGPKQNRIPWPTWVLSGAAILTALGCVVISLFQPQVLNLIQYRFVLALLAFALATVSALLFSSTAKLESTIGLITVYIAGPAALWLISLVILTWVFKEEDLLLEFPTTVDSLAALASNVEERSGWQPFSSWKSGLGSLQELFTGQEESNVQLLLSGAYYRGIDRHKPSNTNVETLFFFPDPTEEHLQQCTGAAVKLQRITGEATEANADLYITSRPTIRGDEEDRVRSYFFARKDTGDYDAFVPGTTALWFEARTRRPEVIIVTIYCENDMLEGDWIQVHLPKYLSEEERSNRNVVGVVSARAVNEPSVRLWEMRPPLINDLSQVPLQFRLLTPNRESVMKAFQGTLDAYRQALLRDRWVPRGEGNTRAAVKGFLSAVDSYIEPLIHFANQDSEHGFALSTQNVTGVVILTYLWSPGHLEATDAPSEQGTELDGSTESREGSEE